MRTPAKSILARLIIVLSCMFALVGAALAQNKTVAVSSTPITGVTITYAPADSLGNTSGVTNFTIIYPIGATQATLTAPATASGATFSNWIVDGVNQPVNQLAVTFTLTGTDTAQAVYIPNFNLTVRSTNPAAGVPITVAPADNGGLTNGTTTFVRNYPEFTRVTLTAPGAASGNAFNQWVINGVAQPAGRLAVVVPLAADTTAVATYVAPIAVTVQSQNPASGVPITAAPADEGGLTGGTTTFALSYPVGANVTLTAPATSGQNTFDHWSINGAAQPVGQLAVPFTANAATTAIAIYQLNFTVTASVSGANGTVNPNGVVTLAAGASQTFTASPATRFMVNQWTLDGVVDQTGGLTFAVNNIAANHTLTVSFIPVNFTVTASVSGSNGTINPNGAVTLASGASQTFTATPAAGFMVNQWTLDGALAQTGGLTFAVNNIAANHTLTVSFIAIPPVVYTITTSAVGTHGTVSPTGPVMVTAGANQAFAATPAAGWMVKQWTLDGAVVQTGGNAFTLTAVAANHTLTVTFAVTIIFHPGDTNKDGRIVIAEVTAYGSAWKQGLAWPNAPSPIPQSYVTNLIMLWKTGELYTNDPSKPFPDTWVPIALAPTVVQPATSTQTKSTTTSTVELQSDGSWLVNVTVKPGASTKAFTLEENIPAGAKVVFVSAGGVYDTKGRVIRWGPFMDTATRILSYRIIAPGAVKLSGAASFDGVNVTTTGTRTAGGKS